METHDAWTQDNWTQMFPFYNYDEDNIGLNDEFNNWIGGTLIATDDDINDNHYFNLADMSLPVSQGGNGQHHGPHNGQGNGQHGGDTDQELITVNYDSNGSKSGGEGTVSVLFESSDIEANDVNITGIYLDRGNGNDSETNFALVGDFDALGAGEVATVTFKYYADDGTNDANGETNISEAKTVTITVTGTNDQPVVENVEVSVMESALDDVPLTPYSTEDTTFTGQLVVADDDVNDTHNFYIDDSSSISLSITTLNEPLLTAIATSNLTYIKSVLAEIIAIPEVMVALTNGIDAIPALDVQTLMIDFLNAPDLTSALNIVNDAFSTVGVSVTLDPTTGLTLSIDDASALEAEGLLNVVVSEDGSYSVTSPLFDNLSVDDSASISFNYYADDGTSDANGETNISESATVTLNIQGTNDIPTISVTETDNSVLESSLPAGTDPSVDLTASGTFTIADVDVLDDIHSIAVAGTTFMVTGTDSFAGIVGQTAVSTSYGEIVINSYNGNGEFSYTYTLKNNVDNDTAQGATDTIGYDTFEIVVSDGIASASTTVTIDIIDDVPTAGWSGYTLTENTDSQGSFETESTLNASLNINAGADGASVTSLELLHLHSDGRMHWAWTESEGHSYMQSNGEDIIITQNGLNFEGKVGNTVIFTMAVTDTETGDYTFTQYGPIDHVNVDGNGVNNDTEIKFVFKYTVTDGDGDTAEGYTTVKILDDVPVSTSQNGIAQNAGVTEIAGGVDTTTASLKIDYGSDGFRSVAFTEAVTGTGVNDLTSNGIPIEYSFSTDGQIAYGKAGQETIFEITLNPNGEDYTVKLYGAIDHQEPNDTNNRDDAQSIQFGFEATDGDGDTVQSSLSIRIGDDVPTSEWGGIQDVDESQLSTELLGQLVFDGGADNAAVTSVAFWGDGGQVTIYDGTNTSFGLTSDGIAVTASQTTDVNGVITITAVAGSNPIYTLEVQPNGDYSFFQTGTIDHPLTSGQNEELLLRYTFTVTDGDGDTTVNYLGINIIDDVPTASYTAPIIVDESALNTVIPGQLNFNGGADGAEVTSIFHHWQNANTGTIKIYDGQNGTAFTLTSGGEDVIVTYANNGMTMIGMINVGESSELEVFRLEAQSDGSYSFTQNAAIDHPLGSTQEDDLLLKLKFTVTDADGDTSTSNFGVKITDAVPTVTWERTDIDESSVQVDVGTNGVTLLAWTNDGHILEDNNGNNTGGADGSIVETITMKGYYGGVLHAGYNDATGWVNYNVQSGGEDITLITTPATSTTPHTIIGQTVGSSENVFKIEVDEDGTYHYEQYKVLDHTEDANGDVINIGFKYTLLDADGDRTSGYSDIYVQDAVPVANEDTITKVLDYTPAVIVDVSANDPIGDSYGSGYFNTYTVVDTGDGYYGIDQSHRSLDIANGDDNNEVDSQGDNEHITFEFNEAVTSADVSFRLLDGDDNISYELFDENEYAIGSGRTSIVDNSSSANYTTTISSTTAFASIVFYAEQADGWSGTHWTDFQVGNVVGHYTIPESYNLNNFTIDGDALLVNDSGADGITLKDETVFLSNGMGEVTINDGEVSIDFGTHNGEELTANQLAATEFSYTIVDGDGDESTATATIDLIKGTVASNGIDYTPESDDGFVVGTTTADKIDFATIAGIDGGEGEDTLSFDATDGDIDMAAILDGAIKNADNSETIVRNIEEFDLTNGDHILSNIDANTVLNMTDNNNELLIKGDSGDTIKLDLATDNSLSDGEWFRDATLDDGTSQAYIGKSGDETITLLINGINVDDI